MVLPLPTSSACLDSRARNRSSEVASICRQIRPGSATVREALSVTSEVDEQPAARPDASRLGRHSERVEGEWPKRSLYILLDCWHHAVSQLREELQMEARILRRRDVERLTLLSKAGIYRLMRLGMFPIPLKLGQRAVAWRADEIHAWIASRPRATGDLPRSGHAS